MPDPNPTPTPNPTPGAPAPTPDPQNPPAPTPAPAPAPTESIIEKDGVQYIRKDSYEVVAGKLREKTDAEKAREVEETTRKEQELIKKGEFETLSKQHEEKANSYKQKFELSVKNNALITEATKFGAIDLDAVTRLVDLSKVTLSEDGEVNAESVKAVIEGLKTEKAYLFGTPTPAPTTIGNPGGGAPAGGNNAVRTFKRSELQNHGFYKANEAEILQAYKEGKIIDDIDGAK